MSQRTDRIIWKCPACKSTFPVELFPVNCGCGFHQLRNPAGLGDRVAAWLARIGITSTRYRKLKVAVGLSDSCDCLKRQEKLNGLMSRQATEEPK